MFGRSKPVVVVSEPDVEVALNHLRTLPYRTEYPKAWDRHRFLASLREAIGDRPKVNQTFDVAPGVYAIIKPFGIDLADVRDYDGRLQVWLAIRAAGTDPTLVTEL